MSIGMVLNLKDKEWATLPNSDKKYLVSSLGEVFSLKSQKQLKTWENSGGYTSVNLSIRGKRRQYCVSWLVLEAFVGPRPEGYLGCHKNDIKTDNRLENLYWGTNSQNQDDAVRNGRNPLARRDHCKHGHPFSGDNLYISPNGRGRGCRTCRHNSAAKLYLAKTGVLLKV